MNLISPKDQQILDAMKQAVDKALERKRRLGQYAVVWRDGHPAIIGGENADTPPSKPAAPRPAPSNRA
jgi:hypothetical protein